MIRADANGEFAITLPYGRYRLSGDLPQSAGAPGTTVFIAPLQTTRCDIAIDASGIIREVQSPMGTPDVRTDSGAGRIFPEAFSLQGALLSREPSSVSEPVDFIGLSDNRLPVESQRGFSWTDTQYKFQGLDATDSWQPGIPVVMPDIEALEAVAVRSGFAQTASPGAGSEVGIFLAEARSPVSGPASWHASIATANTGAALSSTNLPAPASRRLVQQADQFRWFTRDRLEIGGPLTKWADFYASASGQWASQTEPLATPGTDQGSRLLFKRAQPNPRRRQRPVRRTVQRIADRSLGWWHSRRSGGIDRQPHDAVFRSARGIFRRTGDRPFRFCSGGLDTPSSRRLGSGRDRGPLRILHRASGYKHPIDRRKPRGTAGRGDRRGAAAGQSAACTRQEIAAAWQPGQLPARATRHRIAAGAGWKTSGPRNRFTTPSGMNLITADGAPAFVVEFNTPLDSREVVRSFSGYFADHVRLTRSWWLDLGASSDFSRGSRPAQSSPAGYFSSGRSLAAEPDLIAWNNVSPRVGMEWNVPHSQGLVLRGAYFRFYAPLAGRYLDFGNPNSLGGSVYRWIAPNSSGPFQPSEQGSLVLRFGGPYSSISPTLRRPYSDEFDVSAEYRVARGSLVSARLFRRDGRNRIAAIDTGVPAQAFTPVSILDPGPDGIPRTFDDQQLTVYAQDPATLGQDRYLLTNPGGLRMLNSGFEGEVGAAWGRLWLHSSFVAEKSYGPTNAGDGVYENDPGVIGALFLDPNAAIHATGRSLLDRGACCWKGASHLPLAASLGRN